MKTTQSHKDRVKHELIECGVSRYGLMKLEAKHLHEIIHSGEHLMGVAYGLNKNYSAMLVATDRRVIFLDRKPFFTISDEITYEMVAGVGYNIQGKFAAVILHTRLGDYPLRFVNLYAAEKFVHYIEKRRLEVLNGFAANTEATKQQAETAKTAIPPLTEDGKNFLHSHHVGTLSSIDRTGNVHGAVIYYFVDAKDNIYILTKADTHKAHNILAHHQIALTVYNDRHMKTLQLQGTAEVEPDPNIRDFIFRELTMAQKDTVGSALPPVTKLDRGEFITIRIKPTAASYRDYQETQ